ncbi:MAG: hypothetical protein ACK4LA_03905 [Aquificaceae bacterium]
MRKIALLLGIFSLSFAQESLEDLKRQLEEQRKLIQELEKKIQSLEKAQKEQVKEEAQKSQPMDRSLQLRSKFDERLKAMQIGTFRQTAFLPDISLIVDTSLVGRNIKDEEFSHLKIPGLYHKHENGHGHGHGELNEKRGFNLNYAELYFYAPVDPYFDLYATIPFTEEGAEVEEAYAVTRGLPFGFQLKVGKFRSGFGRLNAQHPHTWDFANQPLIYKVFLGEGLTEKGIQINWLAPTPFYLLLGAEVLQGENEQSFGIDGFEIGGVKVPETRKPNLYVGFVKTSFDIGNLSVLTGFSYAQGKTRIDHEEHAFAGKTKLYGFDLTARYSLDATKYIAFQGEYIYRDQKGTKYELENNVLDTEDIRKKQGGFYTQLVARLDQRWRAGIQYNLINKNDITDKNLPKNLPAYYAMVEYNPTEFSRIRLQAGQNRAYYEKGKRKTINEVILQFTFAIGAHGAHPF